MIKRDFSIRAYEGIIGHAIEAGYRFVTLGEFINEGCPRRGCFVLRHDVDRTPGSLTPVIDAESRMGVRSTTYVRVAGADYNAFSYQTMAALKHAVSQGTEIGLHTSCYEYGKLLGFDPLSVLSGELQVLRAFFNVKSIAPHRDINYVHNTLPFLQKHWRRISAELNVDFHAYDERIVGSTTYVNEGLDPHLCWRTASPSEAILAANMGSIYLLTHPHWWYSVHPFEAQ